MKGFKLYLMVCSAILLVYMIAQLNKPVPTNWSPSYSIKDKIPFGSFIFFNRLGDMAPGAAISISQKDVYNTLNENKALNVTYLIVGQYLRLDTNDYVQLLKFAGRGNNVFIAARDVGPFLRKKLNVKMSEGGYFLTDSAGQELNFVNPVLKANRNYIFNKNIGSVHFSKIDTGRAVVLGTLHSGEANFIKYPVKKGALYILTEPRFFSNYNLLEPRGADYAARAMSYVSNSTAIIYDQYYSSGSTGEKSLMQFFFKHPALKYGYYLALSGFILFVLYEIKRRQRVIPVNDPFVNATVAFVDVVSGVYLSKKDSRDIAEKKITYFLDHLRSRYFWKVAAADKDFAAMLEQKTGVSETLAAALAAQIKYIQSGMLVHDEVLINLNNLIESFYKERK